MGQEAQVSLAATKQRASGWHSKLQVAQVRHALSLEPVSPLPHTRQRAASSWCSPSSRELTEPKLAFSHTRPVGRGSFSASVVHSSQSVSPSGRSSKQNCRSQPAHRRISSSSAPHALHVPSMSDSSWSSSSSSSDESSSSSASASFLSLVVTAVTSLAFFSAWTVIEWRTARVGNADEDDEEDALVSAVEWRAEGVGNADEDDEEEEDALASAVERRAADVGNADEGDEEEEDVLASADRASLRTT